MLVIKACYLKKGVGKELKVLHHASAAAPHDDYVTTTCLIPNK